MTQAPVSSPPISQRPVPEVLPDARDRLNQLAHLLAGGRNAQLLREYLRLRSSIRAI